MSTGFQSCGKSSYSPVTTQSQTDAPGQFSIPAKIDILLAVDNTGSAIEADIKTPLLQFMKNLDAQNWDYRVASIGLLNPQSIFEVAISKYDTKYGSKYVSPYPGATSEGSSLAVFPNDLDLPNGTSSSGGEPGINSIAQTLENEAILMNQTNSKNYLRKDAITVVVVISTGDDTTEGGLSYQQLTPKPVNADYIRRIRESKGYNNAMGTKVYSFVNTTTRKLNCLVNNGSVSDKGTRYMELASATGGKSYDVCSSSINSIFTALNNDLNSERINYISEYLFINQVPDLSTVEITKINADGSKTMIPRSGWAYIEGISTLPLISSPIPMNYRTGYAFKLNGSYVLKGNEKATISYKVRGLQNSQ